MDTKIKALVLTLCLGLFALIGCFLAIFVGKKKNKIMDFILSLALSVIVMLIVTDLLPEAIETLESRLFILFIFIPLGYILLKILDYFIPDHDDNHSHKETENNLIHIGVVSSVAISIHNIIEGMALYGTCISDTKAAILMSLGVGLHNIPLGMVIASVTYQKNDSKKKTLLLITCLSLSTFVGGLLMYLFSSMIGEVLIGILLSITIGMLIFIVLSELLPSIRKSTNKKETIFGLLTGIILLVISMLI